MKQLKRNRGHRAASAGQRLKQNHFPFDGSHIQSPLKHSYRFTRCHGKKHLSACKMGTMEEARRVFLEFLLVASLTFIMDSVSILMGTLAGNKMGL